MQKWTEELYEMSLHVPEDAEDAENAFGRLLTDSLLQYPRLLRLYSILFTLLEPNCRLERLVEFKITGLKTSEALCRLVAAFYKNATALQCSLCANLIMCYVLGLYPMTQLSDVQKQALKQIDIPYQAPDFESMCLCGIEAFTRELKGVS